MSSLIAALAVYLVVVVFWTGLYGFLVYPRYEAIKEEADAFIHNYRTTSIAWVTTALAALLSLTLGSDTGPILKLSILAFFIGPATIHLYKYYPFTLSCDFVSDGTDTEVRSYGGAERGVAREDQDSLYCLSLDISVGQTVSGYVLDLEAPQGVELRNVEANAAPHKKLPNNQIKGVPPSGRRGYRIHAYLNVKSKLAREGENTVIIRHEKTDRKLETVELLPPV